MRSDNREYRAYGLGPESSLNFRERCVVTKYAQDLRNRTERPRITNEGNIVRGP